MMSFEKREVQELTDSMVNRLDAIDNGVYDLCRLLLDYPDESVFPWDMKLIGAISQMIIDGLAEFYLQVCHSYTDGEGNFCTPADCGCQICRRNH